MNEHVFILDGYEYDHCTICGRTKDKTCLGVGKADHNFTPYGKRSYICFTCMNTCGPYDRTATEIRLRFKFSEKRNMYVAIWEDINSHPPYEKELIFKCPYDKQDLEIKKIIK